MHNKLLTNLIYSLLILCCLTSATLFSAEFPIEAASGHLTIKESYVEVNGAKLFCRTMGQGKPLIVLHGGPGLSQDYLQPQLFKLAEDNFVIFYDQRSCGRSTGEFSNETINLTTFVQDLEQLRKAFHYDKISILGHSWGGFLALNYAIRHPEQVDNLILVNTFPTTSEGAALFLEEYYKRMAPYQAEICAIKSSQGYQEGSPDVMEHYYRIIFAAYMYNPENVNLLNLRMTAEAFLNDRKVNGLFAESLFMKPYSMTDALKQLNVPTLIIHGEEDVIPAITAKALHENIKGSKYVLIPKCGHMAYAEAPYEFFKAVHDFAVPSNIQK